MSTPDSKLKEAIAAREEGRFDAALVNVSTVFGEIAAGVPKADQLYPLTMALWTQLAGEYPPTIDTLAVVRNYHADLLLGGDAVFCGQGTPLQVSRFQLVVELNQILNDTRGTHALFKRLLAMAPELAAREAFLALPAIVQEGDYVLADRFLGDPGARLEEINSMSILYPLWPG